MADAVETGRIISVSGDSLTTGSMVYIDSTTFRMTDEGKIIHINASHAQNGTMIDIKSPMLITAK